MWDTIVPHTSCSWEPQELRLLKQELAHLSCNCNMCQAFKASLHHQAYQNDEAIQVEQKNHSLDKYIYVERDIPPNQTDTINISDNFRREAFCPNCYFIWDLLRKSTKVLKDKASLMKPESCDKCTERELDFADNATDTYKPPVKLNSNLTFCDFISECSTESSMTTRINDIEIEQLDCRKKSNHHERVTFLDDCVAHEEKKPPTFTIQGNCFCLENFMAAIRPPYGAANF